MNNINHFVLIFLNYFFFIFHTLFTLFNLFGWIFKKTRKAHIITIIITIFSWYILGFWYGFGYCFCTDWHWEVRDALGYIDYSYSYIHFLILKLTGINFNENLVINWTIIIFFICVGMSVILNSIDIIKYIKKKKAGK